MRQPIPANGRDKACFSVYSTYAVVDEFRDEDVTFLIKGKARRIVQEGFVSRAVVTSKAFRASASKCADRQRLRIYSFDDIHRTFDKVHIAGAISDRIRWKRLGLEVANDTRSIFGKLTCDCDGGHNRSCSIDTSNSAVFIVSDQNISSCVHSNR